MTLITPLLQPACLSEGVRDGWRPPAIWQARFDRMSALAGDPVSFSRGSPAPYWNHDGMWREAGADVPVFVHDATGRNLGLACMAGHTNVLIQSRDLADPAWTQTDISVLRNATGIDGVPNSACTLSDTSTTAHATVLQSVSIGAESVNNVATLHVAKDDDTSRFPYLQFDLIGGEIAREQVWLDTANGTLTTGVSDGSHSIEDAGDWWRIAFFLVNDGSHSAARLRLRPAASTEIGVISEAGVGSMIVDGAQVLINDTRHVGAPIATGATAVTRAADNAEVDLSGRLPQSFGFEVTWDADGGEAQFARVLEFNDGTANNLIALIRSGDQVQFNVVTAGNFVVNVNIGAWSAGRHRAVARIAPDGFAIAMDGAAPVTDGSGAVPSLDRLLLGHATGASWLDNTLASAAVWAWAPPDDALRALSARR